MTGQHTTEILWPNGAGFTPCSQEYADTTFAIELIRTRNVDCDSTDDYSPEDYNEINRLTDKLAEMQNSGHVGKSGRF